MSIHSPNKQPLSFLDLEILNLKKGERIKWCSGEFEVVAVLINGACSISCADDKLEMRRQSVFKEQASSVFASPGTELFIEADDLTTLALCKARADKKFPTVFISPEQVTSEWRGGEGFRRKVSNIVHNKIQTHRIAVGETINEPGEWSSFPPHKHDTHEEKAGQVVEAALEEIYYFQIHPETGFGFQRLYSKDGAFDKACVIKNGDITHIPQGYHPVANIPGHNLYYLWMLAGEERTYLWNTDPEFRWLE